MKPGGRLRRAKKQYRKPGHLILNTSLILSLTGKPFICSLAAGACVGKWKTKEIKAIPKEHPKETIRNLRFKLKGYMIVVRPNPPNDASDRDLSLKPAPN
jgi:hypothetical protein